MDMQEQHCKAMSQFCICIDERKDECLSGRLYHAFLGEPLSFSDIALLLITLSAIFDTLAYPQAFTAERVFGKSCSTRLREAPVQKGVIKMDLEEVTGQKGGKGTFLVRVQFRQNATWQGTLTWGEKDRSLQFRSALELLKLIDSALLESEEEA